MWPSPPIAVITPQTTPRTNGAPRPVSEPSSDKASAKPMEMPAPIAAASPTRNVAQVLCVAKAAANSGANVDTEPSIRPASPGCKYCSTNMRRAVSSSAARARRVELLPRSWASFWCLSSAAARRVRKVAHRPVVGRFGRAPVEPCGFEFHFLGELAHGIEPSGRLSQMAGASRSP